MNCFNVYTDNNLNVKIASKSAVGSTLIEPTCVKDVNRIIHGNISKNNTAAVSICY